jgi:hypothetical protein
MTNRDAQLKAWREYQEALQETEKMKHGCPWYRISADNGPEEARAMYDPADDSLELSMPGDTVKIPGKYLRSLYSALGDLVG